MITEIAQIEIKPGSEKDFEAAVEKARAAFGRAKGFQGFELHRSIENPQRYRLMVKWETLENHTVDFRGSENFAEWRALVGPHFAAPPEVEHTDTVASWFETRARERAPHANHADFLRANAIIGSDKTFIDAVLRTLND